jgi:hypothetical protein
VADLVQTQDGLITVRTDAYGRTKEFSAYLCNPAREPICALNGITSFDVSPRFNDISEIQFEVQRYITDASTFEHVENPAYHYLHAFCEVYVPELGENGYFIIHSEPSITAQSTVHEYKSFTAQSYESVLQYENLMVFEINQGTEASKERYDGNLDSYGNPKKYIKLYDPTNSKLSLLNLILADDCYGWTVGHVDSSITNLERSFSVDNQNVYSFLHEDVSKAFRCIFTFNTAKKTINAYDIETIGNDTNVYLSFQNFVQQINIDPSTDDIFTVFNVQGGNGLEIADINFGSNKIVDISYPMSMLNETLQNKYRKWLAYRDTLRNQYAELGKTYSQTLVKLNAVQDRQPDDILTNNWASPSYSLEELKTNLQMCQDIVSAIEEVYTTSAGKIDYTAIQQSPDASMYYSYRDVAIPDLLKEIAHRENNQTGNADKVDQDHQWSLYGLNDLIIKKKDLEDQVKMLVDGGYSTSKWHFGTDNTEEAAWKDKHQMYLDDKAYIAELTTLIAEKQAEVNAFNNQLNSILEQRKYVAWLANIDNHVEDKYVRTEGKVLLTTEDGTSLEMNGMDDWIYFTAKEIAVIKSLYRESDYTDENYLITDIDDIVSIIASEKELYEAAEKRLAIESHPQLRWSIDTDDLFDIEEFKVLRDNLQLGDFITLGFGIIDIGKDSYNGTTDWKIRNEAANNIVTEIDEEPLEVEQVTAGMIYDRVVKLRCVEFSFSGLKGDDSFTVTFSTATKYQNNDFESLLNDYITSKTNSISVSAATTASATASKVAASLIRPYIEIMNAKIDNAQINQATIQELDAVYGHFKSLLVDYLSAETADIKYATVDLLNVDMIRDRTGTSWWNLETGEVSLGGYIVRAVTEYAVNNSPTTPPDSDDFQEYDTAPTPGVGEYVWQCITLIDGAGERHPSTPTCLAGIAGPKGEDAISGNALSSEGLIMRSSNATTQIDVTLRKGALVITTANAMHNAFGANAEIRWKMKQKYASTYTYVASDDPRIINGGMSFVLSASDIRGTVDVVWELWG